METISDNVCGDDFWRSHLLKAQEFSGSNAQYCEANGLSLYGFQTNKKRLGFTRAKKRPNAFLKIESVQDTVTPPKLRSPQPLPDPRWLAVFVKTFLGYKVNEIDL
jgi:hypothetical protein